MGSLMTGLIIVQAILVIGACLFIMSTKWWQNKVREAVAILRGIKR